jgi:hypothetical protein
MDAVAPYLRTVTSEEGEEFPECGGRRFDFTKLIPISMTSDKITDFDYMNAWGTSSLGFVKELSEVSMIFYTKDTPPIKVLEELARQCKTMRFHLRYEEPDAWVEGESHIYYDALDTGVKVYNHWRVISREVYVAYIGKEDNTREDIDYSNNFMGKLI